VIHVPAAPEAFRSIVSCLGEIDAQKLLAKQEAPQNYRMPSIELLARKKTNPLTLEEYCVVPGKTLLLGAELFLRPVYSCTSRHSNSED